MKKFTFSLQKILNLREFEEKEAQIELARSISAADIIQSELNDIAMQKHKQSYSRSLTTDIITLQSIEYFIQRLDLRTEELLEDLTRAQLVIEEKRAAIMQQLTTETEYGVISNLSAELESLTSKLEEMELRWLELQEI